MAGVPCVNDTCSVVSTVDANGRLNLDARLRADGGLNCVDGQGLGILLDPNAANKLSLSTAGLFSAGTSHQISLGHGGTVVNFPTSAQTADSANFNVVNGSASQSRLILLHVKWQYNFVVTDDEWRTDGTFVLDVDGSLITESFAIGGADNTAAADASDAKVYASHATVWRTLAAGDTLSIRSYGSGRTEDGNFTTNQFRAFVDILVLDSPAVANLFSIT